MEFPGIRAAYAAQYPLFSGSIYKAARDQHDEAKSAIDDSDEIAEELKTEIADLQKTYGKRAYTSKTTRHSSIEELDKTRSRSEEHTSELQSLMRISYAVFCCKKNRHQIPSHYSHTYCYANI